MIRWQNRLLILVFHFVFANVAVSKSRHRLFCYPTKERVKRTEKYLFRDFLSKGGRLWKGKVLKPFPSMVFHGLLGTCSFLKTVFVFVYFEKVLLAL